jgi:hypothetical protein
MQSTMSSLVSSGAFEAMCHFVWQGLCLKERGLDDTFLLSSSARVLRFRSNLTQPVVKDNGGCYKSKSSKTKNNYGETPKIFNFYLSMLHLLKVYYNLLYRNKN